MRKRLLENLPAFSRIDDNGIITKNFKFELITPMFGGDSKSWVINEKAPVRAQSVKGHLRFWWRTMQDESQREKLLEMENALWGGKSGTDSKGNSRRIQSPVKIAVLEQKNITPPHKAELNERGTAVKNEVIPLYVAFPITSAIKNDHADVFYIKELQFVLRVSYPKKEEATFLNTLTLWTLFGGVGARTRRGCGSIYCEELLKAFSDENSIASFIKQFNHNEKPLPYSRLANAHFAACREEETTAVTWESLITSYSSFRQDRIKRKPTPGRSFWPEPDAIRLLTKQNASLHKPEHRDGIWFPRAAFGLPILTKFNTRGNGQNDPDPQAELKPAAEGCDRWPSPVILKVIRLLNGKVLKIALHLNQSFPDRVILKWGDKIIPVPASAHPFAPQAKGKIMKTNQHLGQNETIYDALFKALNLVEVK